MSISFMLNNNNGIHASCSATPTSRPPLPHATSNPATYTLSTSSCQSTSYFNPSDLAFADGEALPSPASAASSPPMSHHSSSFHQERPSSSAGQEYDTVARGYNDNDCSTTPFTSPMIGYHSQYPSFHSPPVAGLSTSPTTYSAQQGDGGDVQRGLASVGGQTWPSLGAIASHIGAAGPRASPNKPEPSTDFQEQPHFQQRNRFEPMPFDFSNAYGSTHYQLPSASLPNHSRAYGIMARRDELPQRHEQEQNYRQTSPRRSQQFGTGLINLPIYSTSDSSDISSRGGPPLSQSIAPILEPSRFSYSRYTSGQYQQQNAQQPQQQQPHHFQPHHQRQQSGSTPPPQFPSSSIWNASSASGASPDLHSSAMATFGAEVFSSSLSPDSEGQAGESADGSAPMSALRIAANKLKATKKPKEPRTVKATDSRPISPITGMPTKKLAKRQWPPRDAAKRRYTCPEEGCQKSFGRPSALDTHLRHHSGLRPFECPMTTCGRSFSVFSNLKRHMIVHPGVDFRGVSVNDLPFLAFDNNRDPPLFWIDRPGPIMKPSTSIVVRQRKRRGFGTDSEDEGEHAYDDHGVEGMEDFEGGEEDEVYTEDEEDY